MQERRLIICLTIAILIPFVVFGLLPTPSQAITVGGLTITAAGCTKVSVNFTRNPTVDDGGNTDFYRLVVSDNTGAVLASVNPGASMGSGPVNVSTTFTYNKTSTGSQVTVSAFEQTSNNSGAPNGPQVATTSASIPCAPATATPTDTPIPSATPIPPVTGTPGSSTATPIPSATLPGAPTATISVAPPVLGPSYYPPERRVMATIRRDTPVYGTPDAKGPVVARLQGGQTWFVTGVDDSGLFNQVFLGGPDLGWIKAADVDMHGPLPVVPITQTGQNGVSGSPIGSAVITAYTLRIRSGPSLNDPQIGLAYQNDKYTVFAKRGVWLNVNGPGGSGWVHSDWVSLSGIQNGTAKGNSPGQASAPQAASGPLPGVVMAYTLRLRSGPRLNSLQVGTANQNEVYTVVGQSPNGIWLNVSGPGGSGWVDGSYMKVLGSRAQLPVLR